MIKKEKQYTIIKQHFPKKFYDTSNISIERLFGNPKPLDNRITITAASKGNRNGTNEIFPRLYTNRNMQWPKQYTEIFGYPILFPVLEPNKEKVPLKNLRPLNLLNTIRKILSMTTTKRFKSKVENYIPHSQSANRANRSTTDVIWAHRFITANVKMYQNMNVQITEINISSAFDAIDKEEWMQILELALEEKKVRMCRLLLSETSTTLCFWKDFRESIETNKSTARWLYIRFIF